MTAPNDPLDRASDDASDPLIRALASDGLLPVPLGLLSKVLDAVRRESAFGEVPAAQIARGSRRPSLVRAAAAAVAIALGAHLAFGGGDASAALAAFRDLPFPRALVPDLGISSAVGPDARSTAPWRSVDEAMPRIADAHDLVPGSPGVLLATGAGLLAVGVVLASRRRA